MYVLGILNPPYSTRHSDMHVKLNGTVHSLIFKIQHFQLCIFHPSTPMPHLYYHNMVMPNYNQIVIDVLFSKL